MSVSVVIPVYNGEKYIAETIDSVRTQKGGHIHEIIVIDDGSTDGTATIVSAMPDVRYCRQENRGVGAARNAAVEIAKGTVIAFLDADDLWHEKKLDKQLKALQPATLVFTQISHFKSPDSTNPHFKDPGAMPGVFATTLLTKKNELLRTGGFSESLHVGEFIDWYSRASHLGLKTIVCNEVLAYRRIHDSNMTIQNRRSYSGYAVALKAHLERNRKK